MTDQALLRKIYNTVHRNMQIMDELSDLKHEIMANWFTDQDFDGSLEMVKLIDRYEDSLFDSTSALSASETELRRIEHEELQEMEELLK